MSEGLTELRELYAKAKNQASKGKEYLESAAQGATGVVIGMAASAGVGAAHQRFGKASNKANLKVIEVGGTHADLPAMGVIMATTFLGGFGKMAHIGWSLAQVFGDGYGRDSGRIGMAAFMEKTDKKGDEKPADKKTEEPPHKKTGT